MIDQLFMQDLARDIAPPLEPVEQPATLLAAGPATSDVGQVTVQGYKPGQETAGGAFVGTRLNTPKAGQAQPTQQDREKLAIGLLDSLAGALRGAVAQTGGLPGDIRSIVDMIAQEGAEKYLGQRSFATTEELLKDTSMRIPGTQTDIPFPPVLGKGATNIAERQPTVEAAQEVGTFLPAPGIPEAVVQGAKLLTKAVKATKGLPVGMSTQAVGEGVDKLGFYSAAKQAVDAIQQPKGTGAQFLAQIEKTPGVKPDEIKWTGLDEFLKSKKSVTKAEVQEYLAKNRVDIKEVQLGSGPNPYPYRTSDEWQGAIDRAERARDFDESERLTNAWEAFEGFGVDDQTKFSKYTLPGGENYREVLLTLPSKMLDRNSPEMIKAATEAYGEKSLPRLSDSQWQLISNKLQSTPEFKSSHFDQPNILAHLRVNDRVDADGKKVLFVEEVQSDWHQAGRKKGYMPADEQKAKAEIQKRMSDLNTERKPLNDRLILLQGAFNKDAYADEIAELQNKLNDIQREYAPLANQLSTGLAGVPDAPFKTTWSELAMKRAIQMASEGGYDRIAFTTGKTQSERYDLSKEISRITYTEAGVLRAYDKSDNMVLSKKLESPDQIEDYIGKEPAKKLLEKEVGKVNVDKKYTGPGMEFDGRELSGVDLQIGGEGMKGFYDDILPKFLNKYGKKWDAKVGQMNMFISPRDGAIPVHYFDITPKMRESVMTKGQPMFAVGGASAGAAATQQEDNK